MGGEADDSEKLHGHLLLKVASSLVQTAPTRKSGVTSTEQVPDRRRLGLRGVWEITQEQ